jgi:DNA-binding transcriptional MerR regulator
MENAVKSASASRKVSAFVATDDGEDRKQRWFTIGDLAREFDVTLRTLRFYEDKGLLDPRREGLNRLYSRRDRTRLKIVLLCKRVGFSLVEIKEMLDLYDTRDGQMTQLRVVLAKFTEQVAVLEQQKKDIEAGLVELQENIADISAQIRDREQKRA